MIRDPFDKSIEKKLLENGFKKFDDWTYGPKFSFSQDYDHLSLILMAHDFGYDLILGLHASGTNPRMNIGSSNSAEDILAVRDAINKLW